MFSPPVILWLVPEPTSEDAAKMVASLAWQIPLGVLGILTAGRILLAPYWMAKEDTVKHLHEVEDGHSLLGVARGNAVQNALTQLQKQSISVGIAQVNMCDIFRVMAPEIARGSRGNTAIGLCLRKFGGMEHRWHEAGPEIMSSLVLNRLVKPEHEPGYDAAISVETPNSPADVIHFDAQSIYYLTELGLQVHQRLTTD